MKCDGLKEVMNVMQVSGDRIPSGYYKKHDVDAVLAEKDEEIAELKKKLMPCLNGDCILTCEVVEKYGKENAELKAKLENVQASMYADVVDANMENRRLKRALWLARAERGHDNSILLPSKFMRNVWDNVERKCLKKVEEYKRRVK